MWNGTESDSSRVYRMMASQPAASDTGLLAEKAEKAPQAAVRLAAALHGLRLYEAATPEQRKVFADCICKRVRPAGESLIELNLTEELMRLIELCAPQQSITEEFLQTAVKMRRVEAIAALLRLKSERYGFKDRDFSL